MPRFLGQHFLINKSVISKIIGALNIRQGETIVEIGPGEGALTIPLLKKCSEIGANLIAIEKDHRLAGELTGKIGGAPGFEIKEGDALKLLPEIPRPYKLVGNIPYYITGKLLRIVSEMPEKPETTVLMIQKEVADRLSSVPPKGNLLAAATQVWSRPEILAYLKPKDFNPPPEVDSAVIRLTDEPKIKEKSGLVAYYGLIKAIFKQPRKTVLNNLSTGLGISKEKTLEILKKEGLTGQERPQDLELSALIKLSQKLFTF